jgi:hypothetical protein
MSGVAESIAGLVRKATSTLQAKCVRAAAACGAHVTFAGRYQELEPAPTSTTCPACKRACAARARLSILHSHVCTHARAHAAQARSRSRQRRSAGAARARAAAR